MSTGFKYNDNGVTYDVDQHLLRKDVFTTNGLWACGYNNFQLGLNDTNYKSSPVQVGSLTTWKTISCGTHHSTGVTKNGELWIWGSYNDSGALGLGNNTNSGSPIQVGSLSNWKYVLALFDYTVALKTDGTLWSWGESGYGRLGLGDTTPRSSPVQIGSFSDWVAIIGGPYHVAAVRQNGTLWAWGRNDFGSLGLNDTGHRSSPTQVGTLTDWIPYSEKAYTVYLTTFIVKKDGTLWGWGSNAAGQLGLNNITQTSSPIQIGTLSNWKSICGIGNTTASVKQDGTLWCWGDNSYGQLGLNSLTHKSSPTQIGSLTNWIQVAGFQEAHAIKTDGTRWAWGRNHVGQLGLNNTTDISSPVQIGSLTNWKTVSSLYASVLSIREYDNWT